MATSDISHHFQIHHVFLENLPIMFCANISLKSFSLTLVLNSRKRLPRSCLKTPWTKTLLHDSVILSNMLMATGSTTHHPKQILYAHGPLSGARTTSTASSA